MRVGFLLALVLLPSAMAQELRLEAIDPMPQALVPGEAASLQFRVSIDCASVLQATATRASTAVVVTADVPAGWGPAEAHVVFEPSADCIHGPLAQNASLALLASPSAPGLEPQRLHVTASGFGTDVNLTYPEDVWVAYSASHRLTTNITFPITTDGRLPFDLVVEFDANAPTMIMFENIGAGGGMLSGLGGDASYYAPGESPRVFPLEWHPPVGAWSRANITFTHYIHCAPGPGEAPGIAGNCEGPRANQTWQVEATPRVPADKKSSWMGAFTPLAAALLARRLA